MSGCPVRENARRAPSSPALAFGDSAWTWAELHEETSAWAARLRALGVAPGDRVAVLSQNRAELIPLFHAAARVGAAWVPLNARLTAAELAPQLRAVAPRIALAEDALLDRIPGARSLEAAARSAPAAEDAPDARCGEDEVRAVLFTSGTSGEPKGAELTFGNFEAAARGSAGNLGGGPEQAWLLAMPLFHVGGLTMAHRVAAYGASLVMHPRFDAGRVAMDLARRAITHLSLVPTQLSWLLDAWAGEAPASLRAILVGGGPVPAELLARARGRGFPVLQTYGLTEACAQVATENRGQATFSGTAFSAGPPPGKSSLSPIFELRIVGPDGKPLGPGEVGEIEVRGPTVMRGYAGDPAATARAFRDGWLRTGDLGELDAAGLLAVHARRTDLIVSGGENVYPAEVEAALLSHPSVAEAAVVPLPDATWGQVPVALWVRRGETPETSGALEGWCRARLAGFKVPRRFAAVEALPRTSSGKVDRARARDLAGAWFGADAATRLGDR